jgi:phytoene/squalene synthetase
LLIGEGPQCAESLSALLALGLAGREIVCDGSNDDLDMLRAELEALGTGRCATLLGRALDEGLQRTHAPFFPLRGQAPVLRAERETATFSSRRELLAHARSLTRAPAQAAAAVLGLAGERQMAQAEALAIGMQLCAWLGALSLDWRAGRLRIPTDELARFGVALEAIESPSGAPDLPLLLAHEISEARRWLAKGWPLARDLGPWRGRRLAILLRWHAASLSALEMAHHDPGLVHSGGLLRGFACALAGGATSRCPF